MKLKVFKLKNGKLNYAGIREVSAGDIIVEGETSMAETVRTSMAETVRTSMAETVRLRESELDDLNKKVLATLNSEEKQNFELGLQKLGMGQDPLRAAFKRLQPNATSQELDIMVSGESPKNDKPNL